MEYTVEVHKEQNGVIKTSSTSGIKSIPVAREIYNWAKTFVGHPLPDGRVVDVKLKKNK